MSFINNTENEQDKIWISVLVASYNTNANYVSECLQSIINQIGNFGMELVWINDGSNESSTVQLEELLVKIPKSKNLKFIYKIMDENKGLSYCLHEGVKICSNELIMRMDSDDIMEPTRIQKQIDFMTKNKSCVLCGTNMISFVENNKNQKIMTERSGHPFILKWEEYKKTKKSWILNHPTLCFRKSAILECGNYNKELKYPYEDLELELRVLKKYGVVCNIQEPLLFYRTHSQQVTQLNRFNTEITRLRNEMIENIIKE